MSLSINKKIDDATTLVLSGRLDTVTAPKFNEALEEILPTATELILDLEKLEYISSAGLRIILKAQKIMSSKGKLKLIHVNKSVMEVFDITGFTDLLTIES